MLKITRIVLPLLIASSALAQHESSSSTNANSNPGFPGFDPIDDSLAWTHFAGDTAHKSRATLTSSIPPLSTPTWIATGDSTTVYTPIAQSGLVVDRNRVYALAINPAQFGVSFAIAYDRLTGTFQWATQIPAAILDSWSTPAIDIQHAQLIIGISQGIIALDTATGNLNWSTDIGAPIINSSPVVSSDLGVADRVFVTNHSFGGPWTPRLTCINTDAFHAIDNPYQPGEIVWQLDLPGQSSGNTPAYAKGSVYVATATSSSSNAGQIHRFDARSTTAPTPDWTFTNTIAAGFFSGVSVVRGHVYCSSYNFHGLQLSANTVKLDASDGTLDWSVPTNRTDATPIVLSNDDVIVSGGVATGAFAGLPFFGSLPSIQYIDGSSATMLWDSAIDTLDDTNNNGIWDFGEDFLSIGGWTHQPLMINGTNRVLVGTLPQSSPGSLFGHNTDLQLIDLTLLPTDPGFIVDQYTGAGSTPAMVGSWIYTSGDGGVYAFAPSNPPVISTQSFIDQYTRGQISLDDLFKHLSK